MEDGVLIVFFINRAVLRCFSLWIKEINSCSAVESVESARAAASSPNQLVRDVLAFFEYELSCWYATFRWASAS